MKNWILKGRFDKNVFPIDYVMKDFGLALGMATQFHVLFYLALLLRKLMKQPGQGGYKECYGSAVIKPLEQPTGEDNRFRLI